MSFVEPDGYPFTESGGVPHVTKVPLDEWQKRGAALNAVIEALVSGGGGGGATVPPLQWVPGDWYSFQTYNPLFSWDGSRAMDQYVLYTIPLLVPFDVDIETLGIAIQTGDGTSDIKAALFADQVSPPGNRRPLGARVIDFGQLSNANSGDAEIGGNWAIPAGAYWLAMMSNEAGSGLTMYTFYNTPSLYTGQLNQAGNNIQAPYYDIGSFTMPTTLASVNVTGVNDNWPRIAVRVKNS